MSDCFVPLWTVAHQAPLSMGFPGQEYWSGLPFPSPGDLPDPMDQTQVLLPEPPVKPILAPYPIYDLQGCCFFVLFCFFSFYRLSFLFVDGTFNILILSI